MLMKILESYCDRRFGLLPPGSRHPMHAHNGEASGIVYLQVPGSARRKGDLILARLNATRLHAARRDWCADCDSPIPAMPFGCDRCRDLEADASDARVFELVSSRVFKNASRLDPLFDIAERRVPEVGYLALFPAGTYHGTRPWKAASRRGKGEAPRPAQRIALAFNTYCTAG